jgi:hypothetical protein
MGILVLLINIKNCFEVINPKDIRSTLLKNICVTLRIIKKLYSKITMKQQSKVSIPKDKKDNNFRGNKVTENKHTSNTLFGVKDRTFGG